MSPTLEELVLCKRHALGPSAFPSGHQSHVLQGYLLCGLHAPFCCGQAVAAVELAPSPIICEIQM